MVQRGRDENAVSPGQTGSDGRKGWLMSQSLGGGSGFNGAAPHSMVTASR
jgi:hypothetical protein